MASPVFKMKSSCFILGAGPAGLSLAYYLSRKGIKVTVFEKLDIPGGMARSWLWNDFIVDTGPHLLHTPLEDIWKDWNSLLGDSLQTGLFYSANYKSDKSRSYLFDYPINVEQIKQSKYWNQSERDALVNQLDDYPDEELMSKATSFKEYVTGLLGPLLANRFFEVYPRKVWGIDTDQMLSDWAPKRIRRTSKLEPFFGDQYCGVSSKGTGYLFSSIVKQLEKLGSVVRYKSQISSFEVDGKNIHKIIFKDGAFQSVSPQDIIINTIPVTTLCNFLGYPTDLSFRGIASVYLAAEQLDKIIPDPYHWLYFSDPRLCFNRITEPTKLCNKLNLSNSKRSYLIAETTFPSGEHLSQQDFAKSIISKTLSGINELQLFSQINFSCSSVNIEPYVYPIQSHDNRLKLKKANSFLSKFKNLEHLGTGANYAYNDLQVIFCQAKELSADIVNSFQHTTNLSRSYFVSNVASSASQVKSSNIDLKTGTTADEFKIIAEIGINHNGNSQLLHDMIVQSSEFADIIKLQLYNASSRIGSKVRELNHVEHAQDVEENILQILDRCELTESQLINSIALIKSLGKIPMCTAFDIQSLDVLLENNLNHIKIASMDLNNFHMHHKLSLHPSKLNLFISTGMSSLDEVKEVIKIYSQSLHDVTYLYCSSSYPTPHSDLNLLGIKQLQALSVKVGYSDHTIGVSACLAAISLNATCLEVHFTSNKNIAGPDQLISKDLSELKLLRTLGISLLESIGKSKFGISPCEYETWRSQKKSLYALRDIGTGELITSDNTFATSPPLGICPLSLSKEPMYANCLILKDQPITKSIIA